MTGPVATSSSISDPSRARTRARRTSVPFSPGVASAATGARHPARRAFRRLRSAAAAALASGSSSVARAATASASPLRHEMPSAPCAGAERSSSRGIRSVIRSPNESRSRPAQARMRASARPSSRRRRRVSTFPAIVTGSRSGRRRRSCATRRGLAVATFAPCGSSCTVRAGWREATTRASLTSARAGTAAMRRSSAYSVGTSLSEWTAKSISSRRRASSRARTKTPTESPADGIRPSVDSWSPSVRTRTSWTARPVAFVSAAATCPDCVRARRLARVPIRRGRPSLIVVLPSWGGPGGAACGPRYAPSSSLKRALTTAARVSRSEASPSFRPIVGLWRILWRSVSVIRSTTARSSGERLESLPE